MSSETRVLVKPPRRAAARLEIRPASRRNHDLGRCRDTCATAYAGILVHRRPDQADGGDWDRSAQPAGLSRSRQRPRRIRFLSDVRSAARSRPSPSCAPAVARHGRVRRRHTGEPNPTATWRTRRSTDRAARGAAEENLHRPARSAPTDGWASADARFAQWRAEQALRGVRFSSVSRSDERTQLSFPCLLRHPPYRGATQPRDRRVGWSAHPRRVGHYGFVAPRSP
jgi:hypothetical protein